MPSRTKGEVLPKRAEGPNRAAYLIDQEDVPAGARVPRGTVGAILAVASFVLPQLFGVPSPVPRAWTLVPAGILLLILTLVLAAKVPWAWGRFVEAWRPARIATARTVNGLLDCMGRGFRWLFRRRGGS